MTVANRDYFPKNIWIIKRGTDTAIVKASQEVLEKYVQNGTIDEYTPLRVMKVID